MKCRLLRIRAAIIERTSDDETKSREKRKLLCPVGGNRDCYNHDGKLCRKPSICVVT